MKKIITLISLIALLALVSTSLFAQKPNQEMRHEHKQMEMKKDNCADLKDQLKLTTEQTSKMDKLRTEHQKEMIQLRADLKTKEIDKRQALKNEDYTAAKKIVSEIAKIEENIALKRIDQFKSMTDILTKEQKEIIKNNPELMMGMHEGPMMRQKGDCGMHKEGKGRMDQRKQMKNCR
ncbi:MAG TPA: Spy/CpxP family protein refolding chaperone [Candidatus Cloacimonadota bacterium]|nr:Spy/CpxP family protein refolding chaperone [Candidatus Cloacimonadota bacterium]